MARRFSRIRQGAYYNEGLNNYIQYLQTAATRPRQLLTRPEMNFISVFLWPFGADLGGTTERVEGRAQDGHYTVLAPLINGTGTGAQVSNTVTPGSLVSFGKFRPARVIWQRNASKARSVETSQITGLQYIKYDTERLSCPFGRAADGDTIYDSFNALKGVLKSQTGLAVNRVSLSEENIDYTA